MKAAARLSTEKACALKPSRRNPVGDVGCRFTPLALNNDGNLDETLDQDFKRDLSADRSARGGTDNSVEPLNRAGQRLDEAGGALKAGADALTRAAQANVAQKGMEQVEGRLNVSGANNVAPVMARVVDSLHQQNRTTGQEGANTERVSAAMAGRNGHVARRAKWSDRAAD